MSQDFEEKLREAIGTDQVEIPADTQTAIAAGRRIVRGRRIGWWLAACAVVAAAVVVLPRMVPPGVPAYPVGSPTATAATTGPTAPAPDLDRTGWSVLKLRGVLVTDGRGRPPTLVFLNGSLYAYDGCNARNGTFTQDGAKVTLALTGGTLKLCSEGSTRRQVESLDAALGRTLEARSDGNLLTLLDAYGSPVLDATYDPTPLLIAEGGTWVLDNPDGAWGKGSPGFTLQVHDDRLSGRTACEDYEAPYRHRLAAWTVTDMIRTNVLPCPNVTSAHSERFLGLLAEVTTVRTTGDRLLLVTPEETLAFTRK